MRKLTAKQEEILSYINSYINENMQMPTLEELADHFAISPAGAHYHLLAMQKKGILKVNKNKARGITLIISDRDNRENISIPFFDSEPSMDGLDKQCASFYIPRSSKLNSPFAFKVTSLSMKEAGILPNDIAIMENTSCAQNGDIVLAYIPNSQNKAELRRFIKTPHFVELQSENENMGTMKSTEALVYGILRGIRRDYN